MKGIVCYISSSGHTALAGKYVAGNLKNVEIELCNIAKDNVPDLEQYDMVGLGTYTDYMSATIGIKHFIDQLPHQNGKPCFIFSTYAFATGWTLKSLSRWARNKGFRIIAADSLPMPECYAVLRNIGLLKDDNPKSAGLKRFDAFIQEVDKYAVRISKGEPVKDRKIWPSFNDMFMPVMPRSTARFMMGEKFTDSDRCNECGICALNCPYNAIKINGGVHFNENLCNGCYSCYSKCPTHAIYTKRMKDKGFYNGPSEQLKSKLSV